MGSGICLDADTDSYGGALIVVNQIPEQVMAEQLWRVGVGPSLGSQGHGGNLLVIPRKVQVPVWRNRKPESITSHLVTRCIVQGRTGASPAQWLLGNPLEDLCFRNCARIDCQ